MFRLRPPTLADADAVLRVIHARDTVDFGAPDYTLEDLLDQWRATEFDLDSDAVVALDSAGAIVGYATLWSPGALAAVHPAREGEGLGSLLLAWTEEWAQRAGHAVHRQWVAGRNAGGHELLARAGYRHVRSYWRLARPLELPGPPEPEPPPGVTIAPVDPGRDSRVLYAAHAAAFATNADYHAESFEAFNDEHLSAHDFDPSLSRVARRGETVIGFALCRRWTQENAGFVDLLGVDPSERGHGLGSTLLLGAFARFVAAGLQEAQLGVASDNSNALALYERVGMAPRYRADVFEKPV